MYFASYLFAAIGGATSMDMNTVGDSVYDSYGKYTFFANCRC